MSGVPRVVRGVVTLFVDDVKLALAIAALLAVVLVGRKSGLLESFPAMILLVTGTVGAIASDQLLTKRKKRRANMPWTDTH